MYKYTSTPHPQGGTEPIPATVSGMAREGVLLVISDGVVSINGDSQMVAYFASASPVTITQSGATSLSVSDGLPVDASLTKAQLQQVASDLGLSTSGLKAEILERIQAHLGA